MVKRLIGYFIVVAVTLYNYFIYNDLIVRQLLGFELVLFVFSLLQLIFMRMRIEAGLEPFSDVAEKNNAVTIRVKVKNNSILFASNVTAYVLVESVSTGKKRKIKIDIPVKRRGYNFGKTKLTISNSGTYRVKLLKVMYRDFFNILGMNKKCKEQYDILVMPEMKLLISEVTFKTKIFSGDADDYSDRESGDDPNEIYQIREYTESDSIHDIHWKLSAKSEDILVKERAKPEGCPIVLWVDYPDKSINKNNIEQALDMISSVMLTIREKGLNSVLLWYDEYAGVIKKKKIMKDENLYEAIRNMMYIKPYKKDDEVKILKNEMLKKMDYSTLIDVNLNCEIKVNGESLSIKKKGKQIKWEEVYIEL